MTPSLPHNSKSLSERILDAVANEEGCSPLEFDTSLFTVIDPDALDTLFEGNRPPGTVEFEYMGYDVVVNSANEITVTDQVN